MATATVDVPPQDIVLHLRLSAEEAECLKAVMQNPVQQNEAAALRGVREAIWHALAEAGVASI